MIFANITQSVNTRTDSTTQHNSINRYCILIKFLRMSVKDRYHKIKMRLISCCNVSCNSLGRQGGGRHFAEMTGTSTLGAIYGKLRIFLNKRTSEMDSTQKIGCLLYTSPSPRDRQKSRMPSSA